MYVPLTDRLACPRCGPPFGLVFLAEDVRDRRAVTGDLGCPNCRDRFPIREGSADLRPPPRTGLAVLPEIGRGSSEDALRLVALLDLGSAHGPVMVHGDRLVGTVPGAAEIAPPVDWIAASSRQLDPALDEVASRMLIGRRIPFQDGVLAGLAVGPGSALPIAEVVRVLRPAARALVSRGSAAESEIGGAEGVELLAEDAEALILRKG